MILALCGGVGGAKLALGLSRALSPDELTIAVNTGDDFDHLGLRICPDLDTVMYTLAGVANPDTGWGRAGETWQFMESLAQLGGETWFRLGDLDLAVHVQRTRRLGEGAQLSSITAELCASLGVEHPVLPVTDAPIRTVVETGTGELAFQHYFVRERCQPPVRRLHYRGAERAQTTRAVAAAAQRAAAILLCPSNPFLSIDPMLAIPDFVATLHRAEAPIVAVSPIVGGNAIKGPTAKIMRELGLEPTALGVARHYAARGLLDGLVLDRADAVLGPAIEALGVRTRVAHTVMTTLPEREVLAREVLGLARSLAETKTPARA